MAIPNGYSSLNSSYEERANTDSVSSTPKDEDLVTDNTECPTCRGVGRISKRNEELVALIPVSDSRLKPRKTVLYVVLAIVLCLITAGLLLFFLISRSVTLNSTIELYKPDNITYKKDNQSNTWLNITYQVPVNITNDNFFPITVNSLTVVTVAYGQQIVATTTNDSMTTIPLRSTGPHYVTVLIAMKSDSSSSTTKGIIQVCRQPTQSFFWTMPANLQITASISYLSHTESSSINLYNRKICCHPHSSQDQPITRLNVCETDRND